MLPNKPKNNGLASLNRLASPRNNSAKNTGFSAFNTKSNSAKPANSFSNLSFTKAPSAMPDIMPAINKSVNTVQGSLSDLYAPVKESVDEAMENTNSMMTIPVMLGIGILTILLIIITIFRDQIAYGFQVVWEYIKNGYQTTQLPQLPSSSDITSKIDQGAIQNNMPSTKEVFNIAQDKYKYSDAEPLCKAYGAELATYDQVKDAWNKGADWCNYGWVKGQSAVYPTQESTFNKLQMGPEDQKDACGIPGVNGGYFDNPDLRFGVNCYGTKPSKKDIDERVQQDLTPGALEYDRKVRGYKHELNQIPISPFNTTQWA